MVYNVLKEYSDQENPMTQQDIIKKVEEIYPGTELERKSVADSIRTLQDVFDIDIFKSDKKKGVYLGSRLFEISEVNYLTDAIFSSKAISGKYATDLCNKILGEISVNYRKNIKHLYKCPNVDRSISKNFFDVIDNITYCIRHNKKLSFKYLTCDDNLNYVPRLHNGSEIHIASPISMVYSRGLCYILTIFHQKDNQPIKEITPFRLDYMEDVKYIKDSKRERVEDTIEKYKNGFDLVDYINHHIYIFGSDTLIDIKLKAKHENAYKYVKEWFGKEATTYKNNNNETIINVHTDEKTFTYWIMQYSEHFILLSPESLKKKVRQLAKDILDTYK